MPSYGVETELIYTILFAFYNHFFGCSCMNEQEILKDLIDDQNKLNQKGKKNKKKHKNKNNSNSFNLNTSKSSE